VKPGSVNDHTVCLNDLMATAAEIVGAKLPGNAGEDSVSLMPELLGTARNGVREATVHQSAYGDLALRQGPWKAIFHKDGKRELFNLADDLSETKDVLATNNDVATKLTALMQTYIERGRSTAGEAQKNEFGLSLTGGKGKAKRKGKGNASKPESERQREMVLAADPSFD
jgi:arylsulfatase A-like enzyme